MLISPFILNHYNQITVLVVVTVVSSLPICTTDIAELIATTAGHVVTPLILLNHNFALFALTIVQVVLEKVHLMLITQSLMHIQQTFTTKHRFTVATNHQSFCNGLNDPFTILFWA
jgi:hypothetical protein